MCRLFGMLTARAESAEPWLVHHDRSLLAQSNVTPEEAQRDGWGIAWYAESGRTHIEKGRGGAFEDAERDRFVAAARAARPPLVVGHLRHASNPLNLPHARLVGVENSQPFGTHEVLFGHNGMIPFPTETRPMLGVHEREVVGVNDSEVLFWLFQRHVLETGDPARAYLRAVEDLVRVWIGVGRPKVAPFSGLNIVYARSPGELWAFCAWTGDHGTGLLDRNRRYYEMCYATTPHRVVVGSEPFDDEHGTWRPLASGSFLRAVRSGEHVEVSTGALPLTAVSGVPPAA